MTDESDAQMGVEEADGDTDSAEGAADGNGDGAPHVDISMYQLSVSVRGSDDDALDDVTESAKELMDYLAAKSAELEERPDNRGLS
jgi:hypothetical protein